ELEALMKPWLLFVFGVILCWGAYVPTIHHGQKGFGGPSAAYKAFLFVGIAYFLVAVVAPGGLLMAGGELKSLSGKGMGMSLVAGTLGALGALCIILAMKYGGKPIFVAPAVFAGAPVMNTIVSMIWDKPAKSPSALFFVGIVLAGAGAFMVLRFKPS
ncbi:MAG: hypothetical protein ACE5GE_11265, partial [Phycisphaerae bacterium]